MSDGVFEALLTLLFGVAAVDGWWQTRKLWRKRNRIRPTMTGSFGLVPLSYVVVALLSTVAATWYGILSIRRLLDLDPIDWSPIVSVILACGIFFVPRYLAWTWHRIEEDPANDIRTTPE